MCSGVERHEKLVWGNVLRVWWLIEKQETLIGIETGDCGERRPGRGDPFDMRKETMDTP